MTYFKSLQLANLEAALYSVGRQRLDHVQEIILLDNNTEDTYEDVKWAVEHAKVPKPVSIIQAKHGDRTKTHAWSSNRVIGQAKTPWVFFTRADYILDFRLLDKCMMVIEQYPRDDWDGFITGHVYHLGVDIGVVNHAAWRQEGPQVLKGLPGVENDYTSIDSGVWMGRRASWERVGGLDERLTAWGHAQTDFQHRLYETGTEFVKIHEALFYHPQHSAERDINAAHEQLKAQGRDIREMWKRYDGKKPYS
jgi:hypothetical protein